MLFAVICIISYGNHKLIYLLQKKRRKRKERRVRSYNRMHIAKYTRKKCIKIVAYKKEVTKCKFCRNERLTHRGDSNSNSFLLKSLNFFRSGWFFFLFLIPFRYNFFSFILFFFCFLLHPLNAVLHDENSTRRFKMSYDCDLQSSTFK